MNRSYNILKQVSILFLLAGILLTGACKKVDYHQLTDEDMAWLVYDNNQIDRFTNGNNVSVSFKVTIRTKAYHENGDKYNEFTTADFLQLNDTSAIYAADSRGGLYIYKQDDDGLLVELTWPHFPLKSVKLTSIGQNTVTVGGIIYNDVYIVDATGSTDIRFTTSKIWYSKSSGLIQYEDAAGEVWVRSI